MSLAVVYENHGIDLESINVMMCVISDSKNDRLKRLRRGAVWLNNTIAELWAHTYWGQRAGEAVFYSQSGCRYARIHRSLTFSRQISYIEIRPLMGI